MGDNGANQLGLGSTTVALASNATVVSGLSRVTQLASGGGAGLALDMDSNVWSWGNNAYGHTGQNTITGSTATPTVIGAAATFGGAKIARIAMGDGIYTCGINSEGALGYSTNVGTSTPVPTFTLVPTLSGASNAVVDVACGARHMVIHLADNSVRVFGRNTNGQLGTYGPNQWQAFSPITGVAGVVRVAASANSTLVEYFDRTTKAFGVNFGGAVTRLMSGGATGHQSFIVTPAGALYAWGNNGSGRLGVNAVSDSQVAVNVSPFGTLSGRSVLAVAAITIQR